MAQHMIPDAIEYLSNSIGESVLKQIQYVRNKRPDIMRQLIQDCAPEQLMYKLKNQYVLSSALAKSAEKSVMNQAVLIVFLGNKDVLSDNLMYLERLVAEIDIRIITDSTDIYEFITQKYGRAQNRLLIHLWTGNQDWNILRAAVRSFSYVGIVHDMPFSLKGMDGRIVQTESWVIWDNLLKSPEYLRNIITVFQEDPYLGALLPPQSIHSGILGINGDSFQAISQRQPGANKFRWLIENRNTCCWCRADIFEKFISSEEIKTKTYADIAKELGYVVGTVMNSAYGGIQAIDLHTRLWRFVRGSWTLTHETFGDYLKMKVESGDDNDNTVWMMDLWSFFVDHPSVMIYGTGGSVGTVLPYFEIASKKIDGYIVSDGYRTEEWHNGARVYELSEVDPHDGLGIVVAMLPENIRQVLPTLKDRGFDIFVCANAETVRSDKDGNDSQGPEQ